MDFGAHLPLMDFGGNPYTLRHLTDYTDTAARLGFRALSANDHMVFSVPWIDGLTALAAMVEHSGTMTLATITRIIRMSSTPLWVCCWELSFSW